MGLRMDGLSSEASSTRLFLLLISLTILKVGLTLLSGGLTRLTVIDTGEKFKRSMVSVLGTGVFNSDGM